MHPLSLQDLGDALDATFIIGDAASCGHPSAAPAPATPPGTSTTSDNAPDQAGAADKAVVLQAMGYPGYYIGADAANMIVLLPVRANTDSKRKECIFCRLYRLQAVPRSVFSAGGVKDKRPIATLANLSTSTPLWPSS